MKDVKSEFWDAMEDVSEGMLGFEGDFTVPMSPKVRDDKKDGTIWFITAEGTDLQKGVAAGPKDARLIVSDRKAGLWADIKGTLAQINSEDVLDDVWSAMTGVWFEDGKQDDDVRLMSFTPHEAEATISEDSGVGFLYKIAKAKLTGDAPDGMGWQGKINF